ncbi:hypothetical protein [Ralstonia soli]|uniref:Uncharacterized protein n=1 Tax=Ralstonia soli TaxID=2953896 RepID=A0ABT1AEQ9_9RALS|nr:hypothetical protein [Ralstonia soli]MCO5396868.1 hypothetical protein [Ralstonia soli]
MTNTLLAHAARTALLTAVAGLSAANTAHAASSAATQCARMPARPDAGAWVSQDTVVDGMPLAVMTVSYRGTPTEVVRRYKAYWDDAGIPSRGLRNKKGWIITATDGECSYVLQMPTQPDPRGMASGVYSAMRLRHADAPADVGSAALPLPLGGKVLSDVVSRDPMAVGRTVVVQLSGSAARARDVYVANLQAAGWRVLTNTKALGKGGSASGRGYGMALQKEGYKLDAAFVPNGASTQAVLNLSRQL